MRRNPMSGWSAVILMLLAGFGLVAVACNARSNAGGSSHAGQDLEAGVPLPVADAGVDGGDSAGEAAAISPQAYLRIAQVSPHLPPIDLCVAPHGTTAFQGPLLARLIASTGQDAGTDALAPGLAYAQVSAYLSLDEGQYDVRLVAAGASSCSASLPTASAPDDGGEDAASRADTGRAVDGEAREVDDAETEDTGDDGSTSDVAGSGDTPDRTNLSALSFDTYTTLLIAGDWEPAGADPGLTLTLLADDAVLAGPAAVLRGVNAVPSWPAADFVLGSFASDWMPILTAVPFAAASAHAGTDDGVVDANGYLAISTQMVQAMGARSSSGDGGGAEAVAASVEIDLGSIATLIAVGGKTGDATHPPALLLCTDNQPSGGLLSDCSVSP
jgi:hypothetical protein